MHTWLPLCPTWNNHTVELYLNQRKAHQFLDKMLVEDGRLLDFGFTAKYMKQIHLETLNKNYGRFVTVWTLQNALDPLIFNKLSIYTAGICYVAQ